MEDADFERKLYDVLGREWGAQVGSVTILPGGMNSRTAAIVTPAGRFVAKWVRPEDRAALLRGAQTAQLMTDHGIRAGAPVTSSGGDLTVEFSGGALALLEEVVGSPLSASPEDQTAWGTALAAVHAAQPRSPGSSFYGWLVDSAADPIHPPWVRSAVIRVYTEYMQLPPVTWTLLHTDPEPEAFLRDDRGDIGVIDWAGSVPGPALFDLASAVMYAGGEARAQALLVAYANAGPVSPEEMLAHLRTFSRLRAAVQADYFSRRLTQRDLTGVESDDDNDKGLRDAQEMLTSLGVPLG